MSYWINNKKTTTVRFREGECLAHKSDTRKISNSIPRPACTSGRALGHMTLWGQVSLATEEKRHLQRAHLRRWAGHLAAHLPHSAAWWCRSWCTQQSLWLQPESYSWLTPTWRLQKCWRSPPCKWRSQTRRRSPRRSGRRTEETQWTRCRRRVPEPWQSLWGPKKIKQLRSSLNKAWQNAHLSLWLILSLVCLSFLVQVEKPQCLKVDKLGKLRGNILLSSNIRRSRWTGIYYGNLMTPLFCLELFPGFLLRRIKARMTWETLSAPRVPFSPTGGLQTLFPMGSAPLTFKTISFA